MSEMLEMRTGRPRRGGVRFLGAVVIAAIGAALACSSAPQPAGGADDSAASPPPSNAPQSGSVAADLLRDWQEQRELMMGLAEAMPADRFDFRPTREQRTYGEQILHVATGHVELMKLLGAAAPAPFTPESAATLTTKEEIVEALDASYDFGTAVLRAQTPEALALLLPEDTPFLGASTRARVVWSLLSHAMDIYGQMVVYVRLNGIVPPASRGI